MAVDSRPRLIYVQTHTDKLLSGDAQTWSIQGTP